MGYNDGAVTDSLASRSRIATGVAQLFSRLQLYGF